MEFAIELRRTGTGVRGYGSKRPPVMEEDEPNGYRKLQPTCGRDPSSVTNDAITMEKRPQAPTGQKGVRSGESLLHL